MFPLEEGTLRQGGISNVDRGARFLRVGRSLLSGKAGPSMEASGWLKKGVALYDAGRFRRAAECFDEALKLKPQCADSLLYKALTLVHLGDHEKAVREFDAAIEVRSEPAAWYNVAMILLHLERCGEVVERLDKALAQVMGGEEGAQSPDWQEDIAFLHTLRQECARRAGSGEDKSDTGPRRADFAAAFRAYEEERWQEAVELYTKVLDADPQEYTAWNNKADKGKHVRELLSHPQLLAWICEPDSGQLSLANAGLTDILKKHVENRLEDQGLELWLAEQAFEMRREKKRSAQRGEDWQGWISDARQYGLLRKHPDKGQLVFESDLGYDYFAARHLFGQISEGSDIEQLVQEMARPLEVWWGTCLSILVGLLEPASALRLVKTLGSIDPVLAARYLMSRSRSTVSPSELKAICQDLIEAVEQSQRTQEKKQEQKIEVLRTLGRHDPRIRPEEPANGLVLVHGENLIGEVWVGRWPVSNLDYEPFVKEGYKKPKFWCQGGKEWLSRQRTPEPERWRAQLAERPHYPVVGVSFYEAAAYCRWLSKQYQDYAFCLPTALDWDRAALGLNSQHSIYQSL